MKGSKQKRKALPRCVLDSGGVSALIGRSQRARAWLRWLVVHGADLVVPAPVLVECTTGDSGRDAEINRIINALSGVGSALRAADEDAARLAGALRLASRTDDGIDALVAAEAARESRASVLLTSDPKDLVKLLARHQHVSVQRV